MFKPFLTALRILTVIPVPGKDTDTLSRSVPFFPVVGFILGAFVYAVFKTALLIHCQEIMIVVIVALILETALTGGLHLDGLGDVADGFGSGKGKEGILAILKDPRMGAFGVIAIVFDILFKTACWQVLFTTEGFGVIVMSIVCARSMQALYLTFLPCARPEGLLVKFNNQTRVTKAIVIGAVVASLAAGLYFLPPSYLVLLSLAGIGTAGIFYYACLKKIGGITGDCVGAVNELVEMAVLFAGVILYSSAGAVPQM